MKVAAKTSMWALACGVCTVLLMGCGDRPPSSEGAATPDASASTATEATAAAAPVAAETLEAGAAAPVMVARSGQADRIAPPVVAPVERDGIRYTQADDGRSLGFQQVGGVLVATDVSTGQRLWSLPVYTREIDPKLEADVQWVFFKSMAFAPGGELLIENERGEKFLVNVQQKTVSPAP